MRSHLDEVQEQPEAVYGGGDQDRGKGHKGTLEGAGDVLELDLGGGYKRIHREKFFQVWF